MNSLKKSRLSGVKKKVTAQKFSALVNKSTFLLFFHYSGSQEYNWERVKKKIWEQEKKLHGQAGVECKGLFLPSNLIPSLIGQQQELCRSLIKGPTLVVAGSSPRQILAIIRACFPPAFVVVGGLYNQGHGSINAINHLDIREWASLSSPLVHRTIFTICLQNVLNVLHPIVLQPPLTLLRIFHQWS